MNYLAYLLLSLWAVETIASAIVGWRILPRYPLTAMCLLIRAGLYLAMANDWYFSGPEAYHGGPRVFKVDSGVRDYLDAPFA